MIQRSTSLARKASILLVAWCLALFPRAGGPAQVAGESKALLAGLSLEKALALGETMFRKGMLPSGKPFKVATPGGAAVPGTTFACAACHLRSGLGAMDEMPQAPPITGVKLFRPRHRFFPSLNPEERASMVPQRYQVPPLRPAYTEATLSAAIRGGIDPGGRALNPAMPRFSLIDRDMAILIGYLKSLSATYSPGVTAITLAFATVISDEGPSEDRDEMLAQLELRFQTHNHFQHNPTVQMGRMLPMQEMALGFRKWTLDRWILKGAPDSWPGQLEEHYRANPVFALIGGICPGGWEPVHRFCEANRIPCLFPLTDLPFLSADDYYTLYFSKGCFQEGATVAEFLARSRPGAVVQLLAPGAEGAALARGFDEAWKTLGEPAARSVQLGPDTPLTPALLADLCPPGRDTTLVLWTGAEAFPALGALPGILPSAPRVFMSSTRLGERLWDLPAAVRGFTYLTFPYRRPGARMVPRRMGQKPILVDREYRKNDHRIASRTSSMIELLADRMAQLERDFYRDHLLDLFDAMAEQYQTDYERLDFGPGKRYVSEGCYVMQLGPAPGNNLNPVNDWIMH